MKAEEQIKGLLKRRFEDRGVIANLKKQILILKDRIKELVVKQALKK